MSLADRLREKLAATAGRDVPFRNDLRALMTGSGTAAAVLMAVTDRPEPGLILTMRPETMRRHPGQIAFPGGRVDPGDADHISAALREADEEIALPPSAVEIIGTLGRYRTISDFDVLPVLGVIAPDLTLVPHAAEVAAVFEVPLSFVLNTANLVEHHATLQGIERSFLEITWGERRIWGATAAMLANLAVRLA